MSTNLLGLLGALTFSVQSVFEFIGTLLILFAACCLALSIAAFSAFVIGFIVHFVCDRFNIPKPAILSSVKSSLSKCYRPFAVVLLSGFIGIFWILIGRLLAPLPADFYRGFLIVTIILSVVVTIGFVMCTKDSDESCELINVRTF